MKIPFDIENSKKRHILFSPLASSIIIVDDYALSVLDRIKSGTNKFETNELDLIKKLDENGFLFGSKDEEIEKSRILYEESLRFHREISRQKVVLVPSYNCNLNCTYCWQRFHKLNSPMIKPEVLEAAFKSLPEILKNSDKSKIDIILFGGEPLQDEPEYFEMVEHMLRLVQKNNYSLKIITNGVSLKEYCSIIRDKVSMVQVTLDGPKEIHNSRRILLNGDSFNAVKGGINEALKLGIKINLRVNVDEDNINYLPALADFIIQQRWHENHNFKCLLAPVKCHDCSKRDKVSENEIMNIILSYQKNGSLKEVFDLSGFAGIKYFNNFLETGELPFHRFFSCEAHINLYALDLYGNIYCCYDACGLPQFSVGKFYPNVQLNLDKVRLWRERSALDIPKCRKCVVAPHCGGGCQFLAFEKYGDFLSPICESIEQAYCLSFKDNTNLIKDLVKNTKYNIKII